MNKKKFIVLTVIAVVGVICIALGASYALFTFNLTKNSNFKTVVGKLELSITDAQDEDKIIIDNLVPKKDSVALEEDGYTFTITNTGSIDANYTIYLDDIIPVGETKERISDDMMKVNLSTASNPNTVNTKCVSRLGDGVLKMGTLMSGESVTYTLRLWLDYTADNSAQGKYYASKIRIDSTQEKSVVYDTVPKVLTTIETTVDTKAVACDVDDGIYNNCSPYTSINAAIESRNMGLIILMSDITESFTIDSNKKLVFDLNGKNIICSHIVACIINDGDIELTDNTGTSVAKNTHSSNTSEIIYNRGYKNSVIVSGGTFINENGRGIYNPTSTVIINNGTFQTEKSAIYNSGGNVTINDGTFISQSSDTIFTSDSSSSGVTNPATLNIIGGTFINNASATITINSGTVNIEQTTKPIYIGNFRSSNGDGIDAYNASTVNIKANQADNCTDNSSDTTSGLCIYSYNGRAFVSRNSVSTYINGGLFYNGITNYSGLLNAKNIKIIDPNGAAINNSSTTTIPEEYTQGANTYGTTNICNSTILSGGVKDIVGNGHTIYYNVVFSNGTTTPDSDKVTGATAVDTCPFE